MTRNAAWPIAAAVLATAFVGLVHASRWMRSQLHAHDELWLAGEKIEISSQPAWMLVNVGEQIARESGWRTEAHDLSSSELTARIGSALLRSPWAAAVHVQKSYQSLRISIDYRKPLFFVPFGNQGFYASADGVVLPPQGAARTALDRCLVLEGAQLSAVPAVGEKLKDPRWRTAAEVAVSLEPFAQELGIAAVCLEDRDNEPTQVILRTTAGRRILWGPPFSSSASETAARINAVKEKLKSPARLGADLEPLPADATR